MMRQRVCASLSLSSHLFSPTSVGIVATLGTKGANFFTCDQTLDGSNVMSIAYVPSVGAGHLYIAWETGSGATWLPAACSPYVLIDLKAWL